MREKQEIEAMTEAAVFFKDDDPRVAHNRVWFNLMRIQRSVGPRIVRSLKAVGLDDPIWYEILLEVEREGPCGLRMAELERRLFVQQYALSRHVSRMERAGLLRREPAAGQGRSRQLFLTAGGLGLHEKVWTAYMDAIQTELSGKLSVDEAYRLSMLLIRLYP